MSTLTFTRTRTLTPFILALLRDYECPEGSTWVATTPLGETCVAFLRPDATGLVLVSDDPEGYTAGSEALEAEAPLADWRGCPSESWLGRDSRPTIEGDTFDIETSVEL